MSLWLSPFAGTERTLYPTAPCAQTLHSELKWNQFPGIVISYWASAGRPKLTGIFISLAPAERHLPCWHTDTLTEEKPSSKFWIITAYECWPPFLVLVLPHPGGEPGQWLLRAAELSLQTRLAPPDKGLWVSGYCRSFITWFSVREFHFSLCYTPNIPCPLHSQSQHSQFPPSPISPAGLSEEVCELNPKGRSW